MTARGGSHPLIPDRARPHWQALAEALAEQGPAPCSTSPAAFWPDRAGSLTATARQLCAACPITRPCGAYAEAADERDGVWAGIDRSRLTRRPTKETPMPTDPERRGPMNLTLAEARRMHRGQMTGTVMASSTGPDGEVLDAFTAPASEVHWSTELLGWPVRELDGDEDLDLDEEVQR